jgi:DNA-binding response OmpR family regulator
MLKKGEVLIVDDEQILGKFLQDELEDRGYLCTTVLTGSDALTKLAGHCFDAVLLDIRLPGMSGMDVLREIWLHHSGVATIMITAVRDIEIAVEAIKLGASDYITKPFDLDRVVGSLQTAIEVASVAGESETEMDAIAVGVEVDLDPFAAYPKTIIQRTAEIARRLGISERKIRKWVKERQAQSDEKHRRVEAVREKIEHSALAQYALGMTTNYLYKPDSGEPTN